MHDAETETETGNASFLNQIQNPADDRQAVEYLTHRMPHGSQAYASLAVQAYGVLRQVRGLSVFDSYSMAISVAELTFGYASDIGGSVDDPDGPFDDEDGWDEDDADEDVELCDDPDCGKCRPRVRAKPAPDPVAASDETGQSPTAAAGRGPSRRVTPTIMEHTLGIDGWGAFRRPATSDEVGSGVTNCYNLQPLKFQMASQLFLMTMRSKLGDDQAWNENLPEYRAASEFAVKSANEFAKRLVEDG